jgi:hypothetical protein
MPGRRRVERQSCNLSARIFIPLDSNPIRCNITDISSLGAFVSASRHTIVPDQFDLAIGTSRVPRTCRLAHRNEKGFGVAFIDPVYQEIETILIDNVFKEELVFEAVSLGNISYPSATSIRLGSTLNAIMAVIDRQRNDWS